MIDTFTNTVLFVMLVLTALAIVRMDRLFAVVMLSSVFSLLSALLFVTLDAVDVAFTEAAVGAGISTVLLLGTIALTKPVEKRARHTAFVPLLVVCITGATLVYGTLDMPAFGAHDAPAQTHVGPDYLSRTPDDIDVPNAVTAVLGSYRGYDTLGEAAVVFTAGIGVLLLLSGLRRRREDEDEEA
jgi:multicomponent Na+:H+ antiporter subunit B